MSRGFYRAYPEIRQTPPVESIANLPPEIQQTVSVESLPTSTGIASVLSSAMGNRFSLGCSHYVTLLTIGHAEERAFYEIEAAQNQWSVRELKRQIASSLYERLALSRDKDEVRRLSREGQVSRKHPISSRTRSCWSFWTWRKSPPIPRPSWKRPSSTASNTFRAPIRNWSDTVGPI